MLVSVRLEIVLCLTQDRCMVCTKHTTGCEIALDTTIEHLGDLGHVKSHFSSFGESLSIGARQVHGLRRAYHRLENHFGHT
jgi:hypothetical protein